MGLVQWTRSHFKSDEDTRVEEALRRHVDKAKQWWQVCQIVDARDGRRCRCCDKRTNADAIGLLRGHRHHIQFKSACGPDESWNLVTLDAQCHSDVHRHRLRIEGDADQQLTFWRLSDDDTEYCARREIAVRIVEND